MSARSGDRHRSVRLRPAHASSPSGRSRVAAGTRAACPGRSSPCPGRGGRRRRRRSSPRHGITSMSWVAAARSAARTWVADTCPGRSRSIRRPAPDAPERRSQRTSAWPPFSCGRTYATSCSVTVDVQRPTRPERRRSGYVSCGPVPNHSRSSRPGTDLEDRPDPREVVEHSRDLDGLRHGDATVGERHDSGPRGSPRCRPTSTIRHGRPSSSHRGRSR